MNKVLLLLLLLPAFFQAQASLFPAPDAGLYERPEVRRELDYLRRHPAYLERSRNRAEIWLPHLLPLLRAQRLPERLAWLPVVESAYLPGALSPAGAAGLWQLMPATAERFGILVSDVYDGRLAPLSASRAAIRYLSWLHEYFDGDWLLALAAYNAGEGRVRRAIQRSGSRDFWQLPLPEETRRYVPRFLAVQKLLGQPRPAGPSPLTEHSIRGPLSLSTLAQQLGITLRELKQRNLALKGDWLPADREASILVAGNSQQAPDRLIPIQPQPLFMAPSAGLDLSGAGGLLAPGKALFSTEAPEGWASY